MPNDLGSCLIFRRKGCDGMAWNATPICLMWCLWMERIGRFFEGMKCSIYCLKGAVLASLYFWLRKDFPF